MRMSLSPEYEELRTRCRKAAKAVGTPESHAGLVEWYRMMLSPNLAALISRSGDRSRLDPLATALMLEGLAEGCGQSDLPFGLGAHLLGVAVPLLAFSQSSEHKALAKALLAVEAIGALATSEPSAGSDVSNIQTQAVEANGGFVLSGEKHYVTNAPFATHFIVTARTRADMGARGITAFIIPRQTPGLSVKPETPKAGTRISLPLISHSMSCVSSP